MRRLALIALLAAGCGTGLVDHDGIGLLATDGGSTDGGPTDGGACEAPLRRCADSCVAESASSCGEACAICSSTHANAQPICVAGACDRRILDTPADLLLLGPGDEQSVHGLLRADATPPAGDSPAPIP